MIYPPFWRFLFGNPDTSYNVARAKQIPDMHHNTTTHVSQLIKNGSDDISVFNLDRPDAQREKGFRKVREMTFSHDVLLTPLEARTPHG